MANELEFISLAELKPKFSVKMVVSRMENADKKNNMEKNS